MIRRLPLIPTIIVALAVAAMIALGIWQLRRAAWKDDLIATYRAAEGQPAITWPSAPSSAAPPLFRRATGHCLEITGWRQSAGSNRKGESGFAFLADCRTGLEGPGMTVEAGWSKNPQAKPSWTGGPVSGRIAPDARQRMRLVADTGLGGLEAVAAPSIEAIPNNHLAYAVQWFLFALMALVIYGLALRQKVAR